MQRGMGRDRNGGDKVRTTRAKLKCNSCGQTATTLQLEADEAVARSKDAPGVVLRAVACENCGAEISVPVVKQEP